MRNTVVILWTAISVLENNLNDHIIHENDTLHRQKHWPRHTSIVWPHKLAPPLKAVGQLSPFPLQLNKCLPLHALAASPRTSLISFFLSFLRCADALCKHSALAFLKDVQQNFCPTPSVQIWASFRKVVVVKSLLLHSKATGFPEKKVQAPVKLNSIPGSLEELFPRGREKTHWTRQQTTNWQPCNIKINRTHAVYKEGIGHATQAFQEILF